jgi:hypothetical protein
MRAVIAASVCVLALGASTAVAATPNLAKCLDLTGTSGLPTRKIADNIGVTPDQEREVRARLTGYQRDPLAFPAALDGIGLTPEQITEIMRRVEAWIKANTREIGAPCPPFKNRSRRSRRSRRS